MIIDIIVILKLYLIFYSIDTEDVSIRYQCHKYGQCPWTPRTPCGIIRKPYIPLDKIYIIY